MMLDILNANNNIDIVSVDDASFRSYGRVINEYDFTELIGFMEENTQIPQEGNIYVADLEASHELSIFQKLTHHFYGDMPIQIGYCNGHNVKLNALEYHKSSEINIAVTDSVLLVALVTDLNNNQLDTSKVKGFYIQKGKAVELYATTLHFSPCAVGEKGFKMIIILPKDTNLPLKERSTKDPTLWMKNKWLLAHKEAKWLIQNGAYEGIVGENIQIYTDKIKESE